MYEKLIQIVIGDFVTAISTVIGLGTFICSCYVVFRIRQQNQNLLEQARKTKVPHGASELIDYHEHINTGNPVMLAITLKNDTKTIKSSVEQFMKVQKWEYPILEIQMDGIEGKEGRLELVQKLKAKRKEIDALKYTEVHLFIQGPVMAGAIIGSAYNNWLPVKLYHKSQHDKPEVYEYWMPLNLPS